MSTDPNATSPLTIQAFAQRSGVPASALRYYESQGLLRCQRTAGGHRLYARADLRRVAFIRIAQTLGLSLDDIRHTLSRLPDARTPTAADWKGIARQWRPLLEARIQALTTLKEELDSCIGCGCLSMKKCRLYNPEDRAAASGAGACHLPPAVQMPLRIQR